MQMAPKLLVFFSSSYCLCFLCGRRTTPGWVNGAAVLLPRGVSSEVTVRSLRSATVGVGSVYKYHKPESCAQKGSCYTKPVCPCPGPNSLAFLLCSNLLSSASVCISVPGDISWEATLLLLLSANLN